VLESWALCKHVCFSTTRLCAAWWAPCISLQIVQGTCSGLMAVHVQRCGLRQRPRGMCAAPILQHMLLMESNAQPPAPRAPTCPCLPWLLLLPAPSAPLPCGPAPRELPLLCGGGAPPAPTSTPATAAAVSARHRHKNHIYTLAVLLTDSYGGSNHGCLSADGYCPCMLANTGSNAVGMPQQAPTVCAARSAVHAAGEVRAGTALLRASHNKPYAEDCELCLESAPLPQYLCFEGLLGALPGGLLLSKLARLPLQLC
jgi:hypothetical protein